MKKKIYIAIFILGVIYLSGCRSTSHPCGLAENITITKDATSIG